MKPFQMSRRGQKALLEGREDRKSLLESWEGLGGPEEVGRPPGGPGGFESPFRRDERDWEGRESRGDHPNGRERPRDPSEKGSRSREALPENWEGLGRSGEVGRPARMVGRGWEAHLESQEGSIGKEEYGRPSWRAGKGREALTEGQEG